MLYCEQRWWKSSEMALILLMSSDLRENQTLKTIGPRVLSGAQRASEDGVLAPPGII